MAIEVEIWGGPMDGKMYAVENVHYPLRMAKPDDPRRVDFTREQPDIYGPTFHIVEMKIVLTSNGWKAIWPKGES